MEDITIRTDFFRVYAKKDSVRIPITRETVIGVEEGEEFIISLSLPVQVIQGVSWAAIGWDADDMLIGFTTAAVRRIPVHRGPTGPAEYVELINVTLTRPTGNYDVMFADPSSSITIDAAGKLSYNVLVKSRLTGNERMLKLAVRAGAPHVVINLATAP